MPAATVPTGPKRTLLVDVDGVIAPFNQPQKTDAGYNTPWVNVNKTFDMWLNPGMGTYLNGLINTHNIQIVWCTAWLSDPDSLTVFAEVLNTPIVHPFTQHPDLETLPDRHRMKTIVSDRYATETFTVWFDDDPWPRFGGKLIRPRRETGLRPRHFIEADKTFAG